MKNLQSYEDVIGQLNQKKRKYHLLFGNGFSMAYDQDIFSYNALSNFIETSGDPLIKHLFEKLNTKNFELIMQQLDNFIEIAEVFGNSEELITKLNTASTSLKQSLIDAVNTLHPDHVFTIPEEKSLSCIKFLNNYLEKDGLIFSTNYDLLLYWVLMRNKASKAIDGFGRDLESDLDSESYLPQEELEYSELRWGKHKSEQTIHYLHGTLPLFDKGIYIEKVQYDTKNFLLQKIKDRIENKEYPIFVTAGNGNEKLSHIMHNKYLTFCYEKLCQIDGSLITFGFNFGDYDTHIIDAINTAANNGKKRPNNLWSIYIGAYSESDVKHIESIKAKFKCKVHIYDAKTANIWGH